MESPPAEDFGGAQPVMRTGSSTGSHGYLRLSPLEVATCDVLGHAAVPPRPVAIDSTPLAALERCLLPALLRPPCVIAFSGGRDSSCVLAAAVQLARREGLPTPIALTRRWPQHPGTDESYWQELVISALRVADWEQVEYEETDVIGPSSTGSLLRRGLLWPPLVHAWPALVARAKGGSFVNGEGGDEVFGPRRCTPVLFALSRWRHLSLRDASAAAAALAPRALRRRNALRSFSEVAPWLRAGTRTEYQRQLADEQVAEPLPWARSLRWHLGWRSIEIGATNLALLAAEEGARFFQPLLDPAFVVALGRSAGPLGHRGRTNAMRSVFQGLLPDELLARTTKPDFTSAVFGTWTTDFVRSWDGTGVDTALIDIEALRDAWQKPSPPAGTSLLVQQAWLSKVQAAPTAPGRRSRASDMGTER